MATVYQINKGINRPIEFRGIRGQYILYVGAGLVALLILFAVMYIAGAPVWLCLFLTLVPGFLLTIGAGMLSDKYGQYGLLKRAARAYIPRLLIIRSRKPFIALNHG